MGSGKGSSLRFSIEVAADEATKTLRAVSAAVNEAGAQTRISLQQAATHIHGHGKAIEGVSGKLLEFGRQQRMEAKAAMYYADTMAAFLPVGREYQHVLMAIGEVMVGGLGIGAAISVAALAASMLTKHLLDGGEAAKAAAEEHRKAAEKMEASYRKAAEQLQKAGFAKVAGPGGEARFEALQDRDVTRREVSRLEGELAEKQAERARLEALWARLRPEERDRARLQFAREELPLVEALAEQRRKLQAIDEAAAADVSKAAHEERLKRFERENELVPQVDAHVRAYYRHLEEEGAKRNREERDRALFGGQGFAELESPAFASAELDAAMAGAKAYEAAQRRKQKAVEEFAQVAGSALLDVAMGERNLGEVARSVAKSIAKDLIQLAVKSIITSAFSAGAKSFDSQAAFPVVGPALGAGAMATSIATILGLLGSLPSARGGWWDTGSYEGLMWIHQRERVLSAPEAEESRRGGSGRGLTVNISGAADSRDVRRMLEEELPRVYRRLQRDGAL